MNTTDINYAFARGYYDGRNTGSSANPYDNQSQKNQHQAYDLGYEWGVSDFCTIDQVTELGE
jgi:hypothetical protein